MKLSEKQIKFSRLIGEFLEYIYKQKSGISVTFGECWRSNEEQLRLLSVGLSQTKRSKHQDRLAIDLNMFVRGKYVTDKEQYRVLGQIWENMGGRWGGRFGVDPIDYNRKVGWDAGHFEL